MPTITTDHGVELFYRDWGSGPPIVFCAGWTLSSRMWEPVMLTVHSAGRRAIALDRRGHGRSDDPGGGYDYDTLADDLAAVVHTLDVADVTLVGHSMAAGELVRYVTRHGTRRLARLVFVAPSPLVGPGPAAAAAVRSAWEADLGGWARQSANDYFAAHVSDDLIDATINDMRSTSLLAAAGCNLAMFDADWRAEYTNLRLPTLFMHGDRDVSVPPATSSEQAVTLVAGSRLLLTQGAGHGLYHTHAHQLADAILDFTETPLPAG